jgi:glucokinase
MRSLLGIDIGGTKTAVVLGSESGEIVARSVFPTAEQPGPEAVIAKIIEAARGQLRKAGLSVAEIAAAGIACGGPLDSEKGLILSPPNLPGWDEVPVVSLLKETLGLPCGLLNDADACALAERLWGAGQDCDNFAYLTFGTGLGAGLFLAGSLYSGPRGLAGEIGHIRAADKGPVGHGKAGSLEGFASGGGLPRLLRFLIEDGIASEAIVAVSPLSRREGLTARDIAMAAREGDELALMAMKRCGEYLGRGIAVLVDILNLEKVIVGGMYVRDRELFEPAMLRAFRLEALLASAERCRIVPAALGERIGDLAALAVAAGVSEVSTTHEPAVARHLGRLLERYPSLRECEEAIRKAHDALWACYSAGHKLLICGNGGSAADGDHIAGELLKGFLLKRPLPDRQVAAFARAAGTEGENIAKKLQGALPAISLNAHPALSSAFSNDVEPALVYAQQVLALGKSGDLLLAISTSGNSRNVLAALQAARSLNVKSIGLTGESGGRMAGLCDVCIRVPEHETAAVQELHLPVYHALCAMIEAAFFEE